MVRMGLAEALEKIRQGCTSLDLACACSGAPPHPRGTAAHARVRRGVRRTARALAARARRAHRVCAPACRSHKIGDEGAKELAAALKANATLTTLDLNSACSGAPSHPAAPPHARTCGGTCGAPPARALHALAAPTARAPRACAPRVPQAVGSAPRGPRSWLPRSRPTRLSPG